MTELVAAMMAANLVDWRNRVRNGAWEMPDGFPDLRIVQRWLEDARRYEMLCDQAGVKP